MESNLSYPTKCRLKKGDGTPCTFTLTDAPLVAQVIGQPDARIQRYLGELIKHAQKKHPEAFTLATMHGQFFFAYLTIGNYETSDPAIADMRKMFEDQLRRYVTPHAVTDDEINSGVDALRLPEDDPRRASVTFALQHLRDYYEGKVQVPAPSALVTP